jgi:hypothetical protein
MSEFQPPPPKSVSKDMRDALFADFPFSYLDSVKPAALYSEPFAAFAHARKLAEAGDKQNAIEALEKLVGMPGLESRAYLQAWHFIRGLGGMPPPDVAKEVLGVVVEYGVNKGLDLLAAYSDHRARYWNFAGSGIVWDIPNGPLNELIDDLLKTGAEVVQHIGPWDKARPPAPAQGMVRLNLLTPSGLHFGEGPFGPMSNDPLGGAVIAKATRLMQELMKTANAAKQATP